MKRLFLYNIKRIIGVPFPVTSLLIEDGKIVQLGAPKPAMDARLIDAGGLTAAPGLIDIHVHLRDPGQTEKEDVFSGCRAAAAGGVTSLLAMPNTIPPMEEAASVRLLLAKAEEADARVYVAAALTKGLGGETLCDFAALQSAGAIALSDDGFPVADSALMAQAMRKAQKLGMKIVAHSEDLSLSAGGKMNEGVISAKMGVKGMPAAAENCGIARDIALAESYGVPVHICHVSTKTSVAMIRAAKARGVAITAETAPHYFVFDETALQHGDANFRMNPPLRTKADVLAIIEGLQDGTIDAIATDHAPHTPAEKADFIKAPNGVIGLETSFSAGMTYLVLQGHLTLEELIDKMAKTPACILGVPGGKLIKGGNADLFLFDERESWMVDPARLSGKSRNTPFAGMRLYGKVKMTICRGKIVFDSAMEA